MTSDVEISILHTYYNELVTKFESQRSYYFYKVIIWDYILKYAEKYEYKNISINFHVLYKDYQYFIDKINGINYCLISEDFIISDKTYYKGSVKNYIEHAITPAIDLKLLLKLFESDDFKYELVLDGDVFFINLEIDKNKINEIVNNVLLKNERVLKKKRG